VASSALPRVAAREIIATSTIATITATTAMNTTGVGVRGEAEVGGEGPTVAVVPPVVPAARRRVQGKHGAWPLSVEGEEGMETMTTLGGSSWA